MRFDVLEDWLSWQETLHPHSIDLGLDRIRIVLDRLGWKPPSCPVITVAGTKGKGSCVALLESIYRAAGYRVGTFTSPHLRHYSERIQIAGRNITALELCGVFARIDAARADLSLTYFEFNTLAALLTFESAMLDVWVLEVGMGGRLDAVNVVDPDVAVVTSIGLDHTEWLGADLNSIAREKAGIYRANKPAVFGSSTMPVAIAECIQSVGAILFHLGEHYGYVPQGDNWSWWMRDVHLTHLPVLGIAGSIQLENASTALAVVHLLAERLPVSVKGLQAGLRTARLAGRFQVISPPQVQGDVEWVLDVAHNPMSAQVLASHLSTLRRIKTLGIIGVMGDKDLDGMVLALGAQVDHWLVVSLPGPRGLSAAVLSSRLQALKVSVMSSAETMASACEQAVGLSHQYGLQRIVICGSFLTVGPALDWLQF